ncbi:hypothetical protein QUF80_19585 [Desulfococcaceae bacterium HSG8]|nr:hypothetical protein [Desulfococcaceae bacterium HSG8]
MRTIESYITLDELLEIADTVVLCKSDSRRFVVAPVDEFDLEVESLRNNEEFMAFLDGLSEQKATIPLEEVEKKLG